MPWVFPKDIDAVRSGLVGHYGDDFDVGIDRLIDMITRRRFDGFEQRWTDPDAISYVEVAASAKTLVALSNNPAFNAGVIAMTAALLPKSYLSAFPGDVAQLRGKFVYQRDRSL